MICTVFGHITGELGDLDLTRQSAFECTKQDFTERDFQAVDHIGNRSRTIIGAEMDHFPVHKLLILDRGVARVQIRRLVIIFEPYFAIIGTLLVEDLVDRVITDWTSI